MSISLDWLCPSAYIIAVDRAGATPQEDTMTHTTDATTTIRQRRGVGYAGHLGQRAYLARITGTDPHYGLQREFLSADRVERDHFGWRIISAVWGPTVRSRYIVTLSYEVGPGLYEEQSEGDRRILMAWSRRDGSVTWTSISSDARIAAMLRLMDRGESFDDARRATKQAQETSHDAPTA